MPNLRRLVFAICLVAQPSLGGDRDKVVGTWKLVSQEVEIQTTGPKEPMLGEKSTDYAVLLPEGRVFFILTGEELKPAKTDQERAALLNTVVAYTATIVDSAAVERPKSEPVYVQQREEEMRRKAEQEGGGKLPPTENSRKAEASMVQAQTMISQGNIIAARELLNQAVNVGNADAARAGGQAAAEAMFMLAETYDPNMLAKWGTVGVVADIPQARILYSKAFAGNIQEAAKRLRALQN